VGEKVKYFVAHSGVEVTSEVCGWQVAFSFKPKGREYVLDEVFGLFFVPEFFVGVGEDQVEIAVVDFVVGGMIRLAEELEEFVVGKGFVIGHQLTFLK